MDKTLLVQREACFKLFEALELFKFAPRINRIKYAGLVGFWWILYAIIFYFAKRVQSDTHAMLLYSLMFFIIVPNIIALTIRRVHDFNCSAWWMPLILIPIFGQIWGTIIFFIPGTKGENRFGEKSYEASQFYYILTAIFVIMTLWNCIEACSQ